MKTKRSNVYPPVDSISIHSSLYDPIITNFTVFLSLHFSPLLIDNWCMVGTLGSVRSLYCMVLLLGPFFPKFPQNFSF